MNAIFCDFCLDNIKHGWVTPCDGSGVIATTDWPKSRVAVCPAWPVDDPDPLAYYAAIDGFGYDQMPATMRERILSNTIAEVKSNRAGFVDRHAPYLDEPADEVAHQFAVDTQKMRDRAYVALALILAAFIFGYGILR